MWLGHATALEMPSIVCDGSRALVMMAKYVVVVWHGGSQSLHRKVEPVTLQLSPLWCRVPFCCFFFLLISSSATLKWVVWNRSQFLHVTFDAFIVCVPECYGWWIQDSLNPSNSQEVVSFLTTACFITPIIWDCWTVALWWRNSPLEEYISLFSCIFFMIYSTIFQFRSRKLFSILALTTQNYNFTLLKPNQ